MTENDLRVFPDSGPALEFRHTSDLESNLRHTGTNGAEGVGLCL